MHGMVLRTRTPERSTMRCLVLLRATDDPRPTLRSTRRGGTRLQLCERRRGPPVSLNVRRHPVEALPLRLSSGADLRAALEAEFAARSQRAGFVISGVGSLSGARLRLAGAGEPVNLRGDLEILT